MCGIVKWPITVWSQAIRFMTFIELIIGELLEAFCLLRSKQLRFKFKWPWPSLESESVFGDGSGKLK